MNQLKKTVHFLSSLPKKAVLYSIKIYQKTLSPDHGLLKRLYPDGFCRFYPSCSQYGYESIQKNGLIKGSFKTIWRIIRCNPWGRGGVDMP